MCHCMAMEKLNDIVRTYEKVAPENDFLQTKEDALKRHIEDLEHQIDLIKGKYLMGPSYNCYRAALALLSEQTIVLNGCTLKECAFLIATVPMRKQTGRVVVQRDDDNHLLTTIDSIHAQCVELFKPTTTLALQLDLQLTSDTSFEVVAFTFTP